MVWKQPPIVSSALSVRVLIFYDNGFPQVYIFMLVADEQSLWPDCASSGRHLEMEVSGTLLKLLSSVRQEAAD